jgi:hypothetical protein
MTAGDPSATSALALGAHPITAVYSDDANNAPSTSPVLNQLVNAPTGGATSTALSSSINPSQLGQSVTFTATVSGSSPTGSVQFFNGIASLGNASLNGGVATLSTSRLTAGMHSITAVYSGDANDMTSTSPAVIQTVNAVVIPAPPAPSQPIPTLSEWGFILLSVLIGVFGLLLRRRHSERGATRQ